MAGKYYLSLLTILIWLVCLPSAYCAQQPETRLARNLFDMVKPMLTGTRPEKALPYLEQAMSADPGFYPAIIAAAGIHEQTGNKKKAAALYDRASQVLLGLKKRTEKEDLLLHEVTAKALACKKPDNELEKVIRPYLQKFRDQELQAETAKNWFSALRAVSSMRILVADQANIQKNIQRLARKTGPVLAAVGLGVAPGWRKLFDGDDLEAWNRYGGPWEVASGMIRMSRDGHFYLFYNGPPRRDFILRAEIRLSWGGNCYVLARARYDGFFYAFGFELNQDYDEEKQKASNRKPVVAAVRRENWKTTKWLDDQEPPKDFDLDDDKWYRVEVECRGDKQVFRVNGKKIFALNDQVLKQGTVGFACSGGSGNAYVDIRNVEIMDLHEFSDALRQTPHSPPQLYELAQKQEAAGKLDQAIGNYRAAMLFLGRNKLDSQQRKILFGSRTRLKRLDRNGAALASMKKRLVRDLEKLAGRLAKKNDLMLVSKTYALLSNLVLGNHEYAGAFYHYTALCAARQNLGKFESPPKGYRSLFNHVDLTGWECRYGDWRVIKGILTCRGWGKLVLPGRYHGYRLRMRYRAGLPREKNAESHKIYIHQDTKPDCEWIRAELILIGPDAGMVRRITPLTKYTIGKDENMHMAKPFRFKENEWIDLDLMVKERWIKVKLNNKLVFESNKYSQIENYDDEHKRDFPGRLCLHGEGSKLEISSIFFKPGKKAK